MYGFMAGRPNLKADTRKLESLYPWAIDKLFDDIESGFTTLRIAESFGVSLSALNDFIERPEYIARTERARRRSARTLAESTLELMDNVPENLPAITKAKYQSQNRFRMAAANDRSTFGQQSGSTLNVSLAQIHADTLRAIGREQRTIEATVEPIEAEPKPVPEPEPE